ncbi:beta strand repeat-containing protein [Microterricola viridarii]|uniref:beta strand repeat-containing protein n=1 Tax=Microterricola viridarii TaxID=412690 RepID=UPI0012E9D01E|nr:putative Ig domain-containing protein [Microterricola viridarii]
MTSTSDAGLPASCAPGSTVKTPASPVTLRDAVCAANNRGNDVTTITLQAGEYALDAGNGSLKLGTVPGSRITLKGPADRGAIIRGDGKTSVLVLDPGLVGGISTTLDGLTITGGVGNEFGGGGILGGSALGAAADVLAITNSAITGNKANSTGSATSFPGGGIQFVGGALSISGSTISDNDSGSSSGGGVAYQATGVAGESFTVRDSVFSGNSLTSGNPAAIGGGAIEFTAGSAAAGFTATITDSDFIGNSLSATDVHPARGAAILQNSGALSVLRNTFSNNKISGYATGAGIAIHVAGGATVATYNSFTGNTGPNGYSVVNSTLIPESAPPAFAATVNAANNWWGCNRLPAAGSACATASGGVTVEPSLALSVSANPALIALDSSTTTLTASVLTNSEGKPVSAAELRVFTGASVAWDQVRPAGATLSAPGAPLNAGVATVGFDAHALRGPASVTASLDGAAATAVFGMAKAPTFPALTALEATVNKPVNVTVSSDGYPAAAITVSGAPLPPGLTLRDNGNGTATISGTPTAAVVLTTELKAENAVSPGSPHTAPYIVNVREPVLFTSPAATTFEVGTPGSHTISTSGFPLSALVRGGDPLPAGVTLTGGAAGATDALLSGTPAAGTGGRYDLTLARNNGRDPNVVQSFTLTVNEAPSITSSATQSATVGSAMNARFSTANGYPADTVLSLSGDLPAGVSTQVTAGSVTGLVGTPEAGAGRIYPLVLTATNAAGLSTSQVVTLTVNEAASILTPPSDANVLVGAEVTLTVVVGGYPAPSGHWQLSRDGSIWTDLGETGRTLTVQTTQADNGARYRYFVNPTLVSAAAQLTVGTGPAIGSANADTWRVDGSAQQFEIFATGIPDAAISVLPLSPATAPSWLSIGASAGGRLTIAGTPPAGSGGSYLFLVSASNVFGTAASTPLLLTVEEAPTITAPASLVLPRGSAVAGAPVVVASGGFPASASLELDAASQVPAGLVISPGPRGDSFSFSGTPTATGAYLLSFTARNSAAGPSRTVTIPVTVTAPPVINAPAFAELAVGGSGSIAVTVTPGFPAVANLNVIGSPGFAVESTGAGSFALTADASVGAGSYNVQLGADNGLDVSDVHVILVTVRQPPLITAQPTAQTARAGSTATFSASATAAVPTTGTLTAQWQRSGDGSTWADVPGGTLNGGTASLDVTAVQLQSGALYRVVFTDGASTPSDPAALTVVTPAQLTSAGSAGFAADVAGSFTVTASGTPTPAITATGLPAGLSFLDNGDGTATISGTPPIGTGGAQSVTLSASNGHGAPDTQTLALTVTEKPAITSPDAATIAVGAAASVAVTSSPGHPGAVALTHTGTLPAGVTFADNGDGTAAFTGRPKAGSGGDYPLTLTARNSAGASTQAFTLTVTENPAIISADAASIEVGSAASIGVTSSAGHPGAVSIAQSGALPAGITFTDNGDGTAGFTGTPEAGAGGRYALTLTVSNATGSGNQAFTLIVAEKPGFTSPDAATVTVGTAAAVSVTSSPGYSGTVGIAVKGGLPSGLTFTDNGDGTAAFTGTPKAGSGGDYALTLTAKNTAGASTQAFTLSVHEAPAFRSGSNAAFTRGVSGSFTVEAASGNPRGVALNLAGALPAGLAFADAGDGTAAISGSTSDAAGDYPVTLTATNGAGLTATQTLTIRLATAEAATPPGTVPAGSGSLDGVPASAAPGASLNLVAAGYAPDSPVVFVIYSEPTTLATVTASADGIARATVTIPRGLTGTHSIVSIGTSPTGAELVLRTDILIASDGGTPGGNPDGGTDGGTPGGKPAPGVGGGTGLSSSGFEGGGLALGALTVLLLGLAVTVAATLRRRRSRELAEAAPTE